MNEYASDLNCLFCGQRLDRPLVEARPGGGSPGPFRVVLCSRCKVARTVPVPTPAELGALYSTLQYRSGDGRRFLLPVERLVEFFNHRRIKVITRFRRTGRILDIGCGRGLFLHLMEREGWRVMGAEFNEETAQYAAHTYRLKVVTAGELGHLPDASFDVITINHVLEHSERPDLMLAESRRLLAGGGLLAVTVPNIASLQAAAGGGSWFHLDLPHHLHHFTRAGLVGILRERGFRILAERQFDPEQNPYGWLQTLLNRSGIRHNLLYNALKRPELRGSDDARSDAGGLLLSLLLLPLYAPLSLLLSFAEAALPGRGGTIQVIAVKEPPPAP